MKRIVIIVAAFFLMSNAQSQTSTTPKDVNSLFGISNSNYSFGKIPYGKPVKYSLFITNKGMDSASLDNIQVGCGCTTPEYVKGQRFAPGDSVKVTLGFNGNTMGTFNKVATIYLSSGSTKGLSKVVTFNGETFTVPTTPAPANTGTQQLKSVSNN